MPKFKFKGLPVIRKFGTKRQRAAKPTGAKVTEKTKPTVEPVKEIEKEIPQESTKMSSKKKK